MILCSRRTRRALLNSVTVTAVEFLCEQSLMEQILLENFVVREIRNLATCFIFLLNYIWKSMRVFILHLFLFQWPNEKFTGGVLKYSEFFQRESGSKLSL